jgi:hypothetical protein
MGKYAESTTRREHYYSMALTLIFKQGLFEVQLLKTSLVQPVSEF